MDCWQHLYYDGKIISRFHINRILFAYDEGMVIQRVVPVIIIQSNSNGSRISPGSNDITISSSAEMMSLVVDYFWKKTFPVIGLIQNISKVKTACKFVFVIINTFERDSIRIVQDRFVAAVMPNSVGKSFTSLLTSFMLMALYRWNWALTVHLSNSICFSSK